MVTDQRLLITRSSELHTKSRRTQRRFHAILRDNIQTALDRDAPQAALSDDGRRLFVDGEDLESAAEVCARVFGVHRVVRLREIEEGDLGDLVNAIVPLAEPMVRDRRFAVRVRRRGGQPWRSGEAERRLGSALLDAAAGVDLDNPEVTVRVEAYGDRAGLVERAWDGPGGLPLGCQAGVLALLSGGFDSPVAAWMLMRRGCPTDFVHFRFGCASEDQALWAAHLLWRQWGAGSEPVAWIVDFEPVRSALQEHCPRRLRQVVLRRLMFAAASAVAAREGIQALVTGEAIGQVSSQTLQNLVVADEAAQRPVLRPLAGFDKQDIVDRSRELGLASLSEKAQEVCDLAGGRVAVATTAERVADAEAGLPDDLVEQVVASSRAIVVPTWRPGIDAAPASLAVAG